MIEEASKECRTGDPWVLLYVNNLVLTGETKEEEARFIDWKQAMERIGLKLNMTKVNMMVTGKKIEQDKQMRMFSVECVVIEWSKLYSFHRIRQVVPLKIFGTKGAEWGDRFLLPIV